MRTRCASRNVYLVHWSLAANAAAPPDVLLALPRYTDKVVAQNLAFNPSTPLPVLAELTRHPDPLVRQGVAANPSSGTALLTALSRDPVEYVSRQAQLRLSGIPAKVVIEPKPSSPVH
jgi:hypothetical protein